MRDRVRQEAPEARSERIWAILNSCGRALLLGIGDVNRLDDLAQRHASGRYGFARIQLLQEFGQQRSHLGLSG